MIFSLNQQKEIRSIIDEAIRFNNLNWKIVQTLPEVLLPNTLYFLQVSITPKLYELYHTDKDADLASPNVYTKNQIDLLTDSLDNKLSTKIDKSSISSSIESNSEETVASSRAINTLRDLALNGIKGEATQTNSPTTWVTEDPYLFEIWKVTKPLTLPNSWGYEVTAEELEDNFVFFNVTNGVIEKQLTGYGLSQVIDPNNTVNAVAGKAVYDFVKENNNGVETVLEGLLDVPYPGDEKPLVYSSTRGFLYLNGSSQIDEFSDYNFVQEIEIPNYSLKLRLKRLPQGLGTVLGINRKDGILTEVKDLTPSNVLIGDYFDVEVLNSDYSFVSFSMPYSDEIVNILDVAMTYPDTNILKYLSKNYLSLTSDKYFKREEGQALQNNANPIYISYGTDAFKSADAYFATFTTELVEVKQGDTLRATIAYQGNALEVYDINGVKLEDLFNADNLEKREIEYTFKENGKFKLKNDSANFLTPSFYIARKLIKLSLNASNLVYHSGLYNKFIFNVETGDVVNFKTFLPAETNAVDLKRNNVTLTAGLKGGSEPYEGSFTADRNYEVVIYVLSDYLDPWVNVSAPITKKYYITPEDVNLDQFDQFLNNKGAELIKFDLSDFNVDTMSGPGEWAKTTDFIEAKAGDTLQAGVYNNGFALQVFDENEVLLQELYSGDGILQKREFKHVFDQDQKFKVISMLAINGDPYATLTSGKNIVKTYTEDDLVAHNTGVKKWIFNVKSGDTIQYRTHGGFNTMDVIVNDVLLYYTNQGNGGYSAFTNTFNHEARLVIYCQEGFSDVWINVYTPVTKKYYLTPDDVQDLKATLTEVGNAFDLPKPESLLRLDLTTSSQLPTSKGTVINGELAIRSAGVAFKKFATIEVQGSSSAAYPKKNWTLVMFNDEANTSKFNLAVDNSIFINEWIYKANFIDATHTRNIGANRLWKKIELSRADYPKRDIEKMYPALGVNAADTRATGIVNGYPCELYINGAFYGIGTFNLGKKRDNYNLDDKNANHIQVETGTTQMDFYNMTLANSNYAYRSPKTITADVEQKVADFKAFAAMSQAQFNTRLPQLMDVTNLVDYFIFVQIMYLPDNLGNNIMLTRWSDKFFFMPYDLDNSWGLEWNGSTIHPSNRNPIDNKPDLPANTVQFWHKVKIALSTQIAARYQQLKTDGIITEDAVYTILKEMEIKFGQANYKKETARWTIPSASITSISQIMAWYKARLVWCDSYLLNN